MKNKIIIIIFICFLFLGCKPKIVGPKSFYLQNTSNVSLNAIFYSSDNKNVQVNINPGQTSLIQAIPQNDANLWRTGVNMGTDSIKVVFSDGKTKTDVYCANSRLSSVAASQCLQDSINIYWRHYSKTGEMTYKIDNKDYLEAR